MIRILQIIGSLERAGAETFLMNLYRNIDRTIIQFDFAIYNAPSDNSYYDEVVKMGAKVFLLPSKSNGLVNNLQTINRIVIENNYQFVWRHTDSCFGGMDLLAAKYGGASKLILHSHSTNNRGLEHILHYLLKPVVNRYVTHRFACGELAGKWMFGNRNFDVIHNGIDVNKFQFDEKIRKNYRKEFGLTDKVVVGHIGRFQEVKNHRFVIDIFKEFVKEVQHGVLVLVGDGGLKEEIEELVDKYDLKKKVMFMNIRTDIAQLLSMMDIFLLPSLYEGFPVTLIEAQAAGIPCIVSSVVSKETNISGTVNYLDLGMSPADWVVVMKREVGQRYLHEVNFVRESGYDIVEICNNIMERLLIEG